MHELTLQNKRKSKDQGFALPLVVIIGLFMMIGGFAMMARTFSTFRGSIKNNQQQQAQEIAEEGVSKIIDQLNSKYRYLWVNCHDSSTGSCSQGNIGGWNNSSNDHGGNKPKINLASCLDIPATPTRTLDNYSDNLVLTDKVIPINTGKQAKQGQWTMKSYTFHGNPWMGGRGVIRVQGDRTNAAGNPAASATIDHHVQVKAKPCKKALTDQYDKSTFPGLLAETVRLGNNDVIGHPSANVVCTTCPTTTGIKGAKSVVDGNLFAGSVALPPVPIFPEHLREHVSTVDLNIATRDTIEINPPTAPNSTSAAINTTFYPQKCVSQGRPGTQQNCTDIGTGNKPACITDNAGVSHCLINKITFTGQGDLKAVTNQGARPVRIYLGGDLTFQGVGSIITDGNKATDLSIFGPQSCTNQNITVGGGSTIKAFIYAPCASVGVNGGSTRAMCTTSGQTVQFDNKTDTTANRDCTGGDFEGAIWAKTWGEESNSNVAEISVPTDIKDQIIKIFGEQFSIGPSDFVGVGVPRWSSYQEPQ